jgi:hypothetical protein
MCFAKTGGDAWAKSAASLSGASGREGEAGALRNHFPRVLGNRRQYVNGQLAGVRVVGREELNA